MVYFAQVWNLEGGKMPVIDTRELDYPIVTIRHDRVLLDVSAKETYVFTLNAWNFFAQHLEELISLDNRAAESHPNVQFGSDTRRHITNENVVIGMSIYPGSYIDEWFVEFYEFQEDEAGSIEEVIFRTYLRTSLGRGSIFKKDELVALFQPIMPVR